MKEYRDEELGALAGSLDDPAPLKPGLEDRIWGHIAEEPRRKRWPWLVLILVIAAIAGAALWRWMPPGASAMAEIRTLVFSSEMIDRPQPPAGATPGRPLTKAQRAEIEAEVASRLKRVLTPEAYAESIDEYRLPRLIAGALSRLVAASDGFPVIWGFEGAGESLSDLDFVRRNPDGSLVVRVVHWDRTLWHAKRGPFFTREYTLEKVDGSWRVSREGALGMLLDGTVSKDVGG